MIKNILVLLNKNKKIKILINYFILTLIILFYSLINSLTHRILIAPTNENAIITGGFCGLSTICTKILILTGLIPENKYHDFFSIFDFILNIPVLMLAFSFGFRFGFLTTICVIFSFIFHQTLDDLTLIQNLAEDFIKQGNLTRIMITTFIDGFLEAVIVILGTSSGGISTVSRYLTRKKDYRQLSKIILIFNSVILSLFLFLRLFDSNFKTSTIISDFIFSMMLSYLSKKSFDWFDFRGRKEQLQIVTKNKNLLNLVMQNNFHGATVVNAHGGFTHEEEIIIYTTVLSHETKKIIDLIKKNDPNCFINIVAIKQLHGQFMTRNIF